MGSLQIPNKLHRDKYVRFLFKKTEEPLPLALGRLLLVVDYHAKKQAHFYRHETIEDVAHWLRCDLTYSEALEAAGLAEIHGDYLKLKLPKMWLNQTQYALAASIRVNDYKRGANGRFEKKSDKIKKPEPEQVDAEGNPI